MQFIKKNGKKVMEEISKISPTIGSILLFLIRTKKIPNLISPKNFNEKMTWLKLNKYNCDYGIVKGADKLLVRDILKEKKLNNILNDFYGVYNNFNDIDFQKLPNQFVIKCNHGCGYNIICKNKNSFNYNEAKKKMDYWLQEKYGFATTELHYTKITPKIIVEKYICNEDGKLPLDYKIYCFNGKAHCILVCSEREKKLKLSYYDLNWNRLNYEKKEWSSFENIEKPINLNKMVKYAEILSKDYIFVRVDFYNNNGNIIFGELTFTPACCCAPYYNDYCNNLLGNLLNIDDFIKKSNNVLYYIVNKRR